MLRRGIYRSGENISDWEILPLSAETDMRFYLTTAAAATFMATSAVAAPVGINFVQDGVHYQAVPVRNADGSVDIRGNLRETGEVFALHVNQKGRVSGSIGETPVNFAVSKATLADLDAQVPALIASN
jgi:hypothetical protein